MGVHKQPARRALAGWGPILLLLALLLLGAGPAQAAPPAGGAPDLAERLAAEVERFRGHLDGVVLVAHGDRILLERAHGVRDGRTGEPNQPDTLFRIGSLTKQLTAATVLALVEEGRLALDAPVSRYLPEIPARRLERDGRAVTVAHLLRHTSGLVGTEALRRYRSQLWNEPVAPARFFEELFRHPLESTPGQRFRYSSAGYMLLGELVRRVTGGSFEAALR